jgi:amino acid adenylation domain-containing protein/non-ribosomal peptide synthase protein (TIGR01720 family)
MNDIDADALLALLLDDETLDPDVIRPRDSGASAPLSFQQQRLWFLQLYDPEGAAYNSVRALRLRGRLDVPALEAAFRRLVERHAVLRTRFEGGEGEPLQVVLPQVDVAIEYAVLPAVGEPGAEPALTAWLQARVRRPFDLARPPLLRVALARRGETPGGAGEWVLLLVMHHIVVDAWSTAVLVRDLARAYSEALRDPARRGGPLPAQALDYADYAAWQRRHFAGDRRENALARWKDYFGGDVPVLALPTDRPRDAEGNRSGGRIDFALQPDLVRSVQALCREEGCTPFVVLLSAWQLLLGRLSGQSDFAVGVPNAARGRAEVQDLLGFFVNTQVYRVRLDPRLSVRALCRRLRGEAMAALDQADVPFELLLDGLGLARDARHTPLFQSLFNFRTTRDAAPLALDGVTAELIDIDTGIAQFDLSLDVAADGHGIDCRVEFDAGLFDRTTVERWRDSFVEVLRRMVSAPDRVLGSIGLLTAMDQARLSDWNGTDVAYEAVPTVLLLIERQSRSTPEAEALVFGAERLSYAELDRRTNRLAQALAARGVGPDVLVGVAAERSVEMVLALLGIAKAGGAYLPLDPEHPRDRLAGTIAETGLTLVLAQAHLADRLPQIDGVEIVAIEGWDLSGYADAAPDVAWHPEGLAYCITTSGSTGKPKAVGNSHKGLLNRLQWMQAEYGIGPGDRVLQKTPYGFDVSVWEFFWPLMTGACLVMAEPGAHRDPEALGRVIRAEGITTLHFVPSMLGAFAASGELPACRSLRRILCSGEALPRELQDEVLGQTTAGLHNLYGPTEAAIDVTFWACRPEEGQRSVPIGHAIANTRIHILDAELNPVPEGVSGELYIAGVNLARGYLGRPDLTADRFVPDPDGPSGSRMYRSGDLVRRREDGAIEYLGRLDHQVKLRGLRIELGEIEAGLRAYPGVRDAVVLLRQGRLVGYVAGEAQPDEAELKQHLSALVPEYMVPSRIMVLPALPLLPTGKLDRKALPEPEWESGSGAEPEGETEQAIAGIWSEVLGLRAVGRDDNFFELGGDSILSLQVVSRARRAGLVLTPRQLFEHQTVRGLAAVAGREAVAAVPETATGEALLTPIQRWFFGTEIPQRQHWNQSVLLAPRAAMDAEALRRALAAVVAHHDALRLRFTQGQNGAWTQAYAEPAEQDWLWLCSVADEAAQAAVADEAQRSLDLTEGPLLRAVLVDRWDGTQRLLLVIHHLVVDGVSWRILLEDLQTAYGQTVAGEPITLPETSSGFGAWGKALQAHAASPELLAELPYWQDVLNGPSDFPVARPEGANTVLQRAEHRQRFDAGLTEGLVTAGRAWRAGVEDLLLTALARALCRHSGETSALVALEGHGREELGGLDLSRTVGWFTSLYPVRLTPVADLEASLKAVKEQLRAVPQRGLGYGVLRHMGSPVVQAALSDRPWPAVTFNYLGRFDGVTAGAFALARESTGRDQSEGSPLGAELVVNGQVSEGALSLTWLFSAARHDAGTIEGLARAFATELQALVELCSAPGAGGLTPSDVPLAGLGQVELDALPVPAQEIEDLYPLSPMQQGMLFHSLQVPELYVTQIRVDVDGLDAGRFARAWEAAVEAHAILRTGFLGQDDRPLQLVRRRAPSPVQQLDWRGKPDLEQALADLAASDRARGFDLAAPPLLRVLLVRTAEDRHRLILTSHHLLLDGWSTSRLIGEVLTRYHGKTPALPSGRYRDYIAWLGQRNQAADQGFWRERLSGVEEPTLLASALPAAAVPAPEAQPGHDSRKLRLDATATDALKAFARREHVTLNTLVQGAWALLLSRITGQRRVVFGATVSGRPAELRDAEALLGLFINTLPVAPALDPARSVGDWLRELQAENAALREHEHTPLYEIQGWAGQGGRSLFDTLLVFENYPVDQALRKRDSQGLRFGTVSNLETTNYALMLTIQAGGDVEIGWSWRRDAFDQDRIERLMRQFKALLRRLAEDAATPLGRVVLPTVEEQRRLSVWNGTDVAYEAVPTVLTLIERQARATPEAEALVFGAERLSYAELDRRTNRLAQALAVRGVGPDVLVGVAAERSVEMVLALLGIAKAGGAYLPLDPEHPRDRLAGTIAETGLTLVLAQAHLLDRVPELDGVEVVVLEGWDLSGYPDQAPDVAWHPEGLAYCITTSGSTGKPKAVGNSHKGLLNRLQWMQAEYGIGPGDRVLQKTPYGFDVSVWEFFWPLMTGACLVVAEPGAHRDPEVLGRVIRDEGITTLHFVPSMLGAFAASGELPACRSLRRILCSGEALPRELQDEVLGQTTAGLHNLYGPTEAAIDVTFWACRPEEGQRSVPIGHAIANTRIHVLDADLNPVPAGVSGELYIAGVNLARGYLGRPDLTADRFVPDPDGPSGSRMYRSGDLVRRREDGAIEYLGRLDHQVKLRGLRIELGEIEAGLRAYPGVRDAVVLLRQGRLVGYVASDAQLDEAALPQHLSALVPEYMVPSRIMMLAALPLSANGKLDRKALPDPEWESGAETQAEPEGETEQAIARIWIDVLGLARVSRHDDFFSLGGHSLLATRVASRLRQALAVELPLAALFETRTIAGLAALIDRHGRGNAAAELDAMSELLDALELPE